MNNIAIIVYYVKTDAKLSLTLLGLKFFIKSILCMYNVCTHLLESCRQADVKRYSFLEFWTPVIKNYSCFNRDVTRNR